MDWICSRKKKKHQRYINRRVRIMNKVIEEDELWRGRFFIRQVGSPQWYEYEDGSGGEYYVTLRFYDKKTLKYADLFGNANEWCHLNASRLWTTMNDFITKDINVWENEDPRTDKEDYNTIPADSVIKKMTPIFDFPRRARF